MSAFLRYGLIGGALALAGCSDTLPPEGQVIVTVWTDAPLPDPSGADGQGVAVPALFDRLRFDVVPPDGDMPCDDCSREFGIDRTSFAGGGASIGIAPPVGEHGWRVRVRLYRSGGTLSPEPRPASTLEKTVALPAIADEGKLRVHVILWTRTVAVPVGSLAEPFEPDDLEDAPSPGSWAGATRRGCAEPAGPDEICIPGGAYWMGDPRLDFSAAFDMDGSLERLVVIDPFYLQRSELRVGAFRRSGLAESLTPGGPSDNPHTPTVSFPQCTYTDEPGPFEDLPTVCLSWTKAQQYCESIGRRLPTEAELEYVASGLGHSTYVWGEEPPRCEDAVFSRDTETAACGAFGVGVALPGSGQRDRLVLGDGEIVDVSGNAREWVLDRWNRQEEPCWGTGLFDNPVCDAPSPADGDDVRSLRGGDWQGDELDLRAAVRTRLVNEDQAVSARVGFRCAREATPE